ncbi:MAG: M48 family metalloprotease [Hydrogenophilales bacterium]|nr:M48 family metalloprotease [Hydrogenophilales bacterium]
MAAGLNDGQPLRLAFGTPPQRTEPAKPPEDATKPQSESSAERLLQALLAGKMSTQQEHQLGERIIGNLLGVAPLVPDDGLQRYINQVGRWVASQSERPDLDWRFGVIESEDVNAFAAPGGYVMVTKGLYRRLNNEAELAGVLGHEIGHVMSRHHVKLLQRSQLLASLSGALGKQVSDEHERLQSIIGRGAEVAARSLDKSSEFEADRIGMVLAARGGYDAYGLPLVLQEIGHFSEKDDRVALLFKTHPHPDARFNQLAEAVGTRFDALTEGATLESRFYRLK